MIGSLCFKAAGAQVDSTLESALMVVFCSPAHKRLAVSYVSLQAACCPMNSEELASSLSRSWISVLLYRRCLMSCLNSFFSRGRQEVDSLPGSFVRAFPRKAAGELTLLAVLAPVIVSNVTIPFSENIYCSDASLEKGAVCSAPAGAEVSSALRMTADKKGSFDGRPDRLIVLSCAAPLGLRVGPVLDLSVSGQFDFRDLMILDWLILVDLHGQQGHI